MSTSIEVSKIINEVSFRINNNEYKRATDRIKKIAGLFNKSTNQYAQSMQAGKRMANVQAKSTKDQTRAELKAYRQKQQTLKADNIRYRDQIKNSEQFRKSLQRANSDYLLGNKSFKERSAIIGQLNRQYRQLNTQSSKLGVRGIVGRVGSSVAGSMATAAALGAGVVGAGGFATQQGFNSVKSKGQQFEQLDIILNNVFKERAVEISNRIATLANKNGRDILDLGNSLVEFAALMKPLGNTVDDSLTIFQKYQDMIATYGLDKEQSKGFMTQWSQALSQNTLDSYLEAMRQWNPQLKANFETWIKDKKGINDFLDNITGGKKYNLKKFMDEYLTANSGHYAQGAAGYKKSSMANDSRSSNSVSVALYRIFESSGFQQAMKSASNIIRYWGNLLEMNAGKLGEIFGNLYGITEDLSKQGFEELSKWLQELTKEDVKQHFGDLKNGVSDFVDVMKRLVSFLDSILPDSFKQQIQSSKVKDKDRSNYDSTQYGKAYVEEERRLLNQGFAPSEAATRAEQFALSASRIIQPPQLSFTPQNAPTNYVMRSSQNAPQAISDISGKLNLEVSATVKQSGFSDFVDLRINDNNLKILNVWE
jgi:hypothetical protein